MDQTENFLEALVVYQPVTKKNLRGLGVNSGHSKFLCDVLKNRFFGYFKGFKKYYNIKEVDRT